MKLKLHDKQIKRIAKRIEGQSVPDEYYGTQDEDQGITILKQLAENINVMIGYLEEDRDWDRNFNDMANSLHYLVDEFDKIMNF